MTYQRYTLDKSITEVFKEHIPNKIIKERQQGKEKLSYVSGSVILDMINKATNYNWDFIVEERWIQESRDKFNPKYAIRISSKNFGYNPDTKVKSVPLYATYLIK